ncbi:MAG: FHA domain-containing protein, partial [Propioniciclava sp.]
HQISDHHVSAEHVELQGQRNRWTVRDLDSSNGTWVNGRRVTNATLQAGDTLRVGQTTFTFQPGPP